MYSNNRCIIILINHDVINSIMKNINLNITSTNRVITNISIYLSIYSLNVYYIFKCFNLVFNTLLCLRTLEDNIVQIDNEAEPALDMI